MQQESFNEESWASMYYGFGVEPEEVPVSSNPDQTFSIMNKMKVAIEKGCGYASSHAEFLETL